MIVIHILGYILLTYLCVIVALGSVDSPSGPFLYRLGWQVFNLTITFWALLGIAIFFVSLY